MKKTTQKILPLLLTFSLSITVFSGCGTGSSPAPSSSTSNPEPSSAADLAPSESTPETPEAKKVLLVTSFGTSYKSFNRRLSGIRNAAGFYQPNHH